jgi:hypothetical protein
MDPYPDRFMVLYAYSNDSILSNNVVKVAERTISPPFRFVCGRYTGVKVGLK